MRPVAVVAVLVVAALQLNDLKLVAHTGFESAHLTSFGARI